MPNHHINSLPNDIRDMIFAKVVYNPYQEIQEWKASLSILAVCKLWRYEACARVYSTIYIDTYDIGRFSLDDTYYETDDTTDKSIEIEFCDNLSLIEKNCMSQHTREVSIRVETTKEAYMALEIIKNAVQYLDIDLSKIKVLGLYKPNNRQSFGFDYRHHVRYIEKAFDAVVKLFPSIQTVRSTSPFTKSSKIGQLRNKIIDHYIVNLKKLITTGSLELAVPAFPQQITALELSLCAHFTQQLPLIFSKQLRYLSLNYIHSNTTFDVFEKAATKGVLEFPKLEYLHIYYGPQLRFGRSLDPNRARLPDNKTWLVFPSLRKLDFLCCYPYCPLLEKSVFPERLSWVKLNCHVSLLERFARIKWKHINWLQTTVNIERDEYIEKFLESSNMLFGNSCAIKDASMLIYGYSSLANSAQIEWPSITKLMFNEIKAADLLELLRFLPNLAILKVASLDTEQMPQLLGKKEERYQLACSHSLTIAALIEYPRMGTASHFDEILIFITQSCSKLKYLTLAYTAEEMWSNLVAKHQASSPHLSNIQCSFQYGSIN